MCSLSPAMSDISLFPACLTDLDCVEMATRAGADYRCFQYRCFPWDQPELHGDLRSCKNKDDCKQLEKEEGGVGEDGDCFKHEDRRTIHNGVCVRSADQCSEPDDCGEDLVCINGYCGDREYLEELKKFPCGDDQSCMDLFSVEYCCLDFTSDILDKKCCDDVAIHPLNISEFANKIRLNVGTLTEHENEVLCVIFGQSQDLRETIPHCTEEFIKRIETAEETMNTSSLSSITTMSNISRAVSVEITSAAATIDTQEDMELSDIVIETMEVRNKNTGSTLDLDQTFYYYIFTLFTLVQVHVVPLL